jgi:hypothetical protein
MVCDPLLRIRHVFGGKDELPQQDLRYLRCR